MNVALAGDMAGVFLFREHPKRPSCSGSVPSICYDECVVTGSNPRDKPQEDERPGRALSLLTIRPPHPTSFRNASNRRSSALRLLVSFSTSFGVAMIFSSGETSSANARMPGWI